jgi:hypothetical protein
VLCQLEHKKIYMKLSSKAENIYDQINNKTTKLGDLRKIAKVLSQELIDKLDKDIQNHPLEERNQLIDWLMANQLSKDKKTVALMQSWENSPSALQRRTFWYHQARLRWMGQTPPPNTESLLSLIEERIEGEKPEVQWAMNFTAGQIGVFQPEFRSRCIALGERTGLYKDEVVPRNCTPSYLPKFIPIQVAKLKK